MNDFKVGDKVRVLEEAVGGDVQVGTIDVITYVCSNGVVRVGTGYASWFLGFSGGKLELVKAEAEYPNPPHIHHKEIIAWAKGAQIQWFGPLTETWYDSASVLVWKPDGKYRVKPDVDPRLEALNEKLAELNKEISEIKKQIGVKVMKSVINVEFNTGEISLSANDVLEKSKDNYKSLLIIGWDKEGYHDVRSTNNLDQKDCLYLAQMFTHKLLSGEYAPD